MQNRMMITGAGSGLGREIALRWARDGWRVTAGAWRWPTSTKPAWRKA